MYKFIDAILDSEDLVDIFPDTSKELDKPVQGFALLISHGTIQGCVECLDGFLTTDTSAFKQ